MTIPYASLFFTMATHATSVTPTFTELRKSARPLLVSLVRASLSLLRLTIRETVTISLLWIAVIVFKVSGIFIYSFSIERTCTSL